MPKLVLVLVVLSIAFMSSDCVSLRSGDSQTKTFSSGFGIPDHHVFSKNSPLKVSIYESLEALALKRANHLKVEAKVNGRPRQTLELKRIGDKDSWYCRYPKLNVRNTARVTNLPESFYLILPCQDLESSHAHVQNEYLSYRSSLAMGFPTLGARLVELTLSADTTKKKKLVSILLEDVALKAGSRNWNFFEQGDNRLIDWPVPELAAAMIAIQSCHLGKGDLAYPTHMSHSVGSFNESWSLYYNMKNIFFIQPKTKSKSQEGWYVPFDISYTPKKPKACLKKMISVMEKNKFPSRRATAQAFQIVYSHQESALRNLSLELSANKKQRGSFLANMRLFYGAVRSVANESLGLRL